MNKSMVSRVWILTLCSISSVSTIEDRLTVLFKLISVPEWLHGIFMMGIYRTLTWVISVMLPPMTIFFLLFTLLGDLGYLPRVAFNLDNFFPGGRENGRSLSQQLLESIIVLIIFYP